MLCYPFMFSAVYNFILVSAASSIQHDQELTVVNLSRATLGFACPCAVPYTHDQRLSLKELMPAMCRYTPTRQAGRAEPCVYGHITRIPSRMAAPIARQTCARARCVVLNPCLTRGDVAPLFKKVHHQNGPLA